MDMFMLGGDIEFIPTLLGYMKACLEEGDVDISRVDDAVKRILAVKLSMGLIRKKGEVKEKREMQKPEDVEVTTP
jgi:beta-glucosidase